MRRAIFLASLLAIAFGCRAAPPPGESGPREEALPPGLTVRPYDGVFGDYRPMRDALVDLDAIVQESRALISRRLGLRLDPDRSRLLSFTDDRQDSAVETLARAGRMVQEIQVPSAPVAQQRIAVADLMAEALCLAAVSDPANEQLPAWYRRGAPLWVSGLWKRRLMERILGGPSVVLDVDRVVPMIALSGSRPDPLASALFLRYVAEEFGADRLPALTRSLAGSDSTEEGLAAALGTDPASLPVAFDGYRLRVVSEITEDPFVRELASIRDRDPAERAQRLTGLAPRAPDRFVAAAIQEMLGLSQFEAGDFSAAADTLAEVERSYAAHALHAARDRFYFALTFSRRGEDEAAALRLSSFLAEFPSSEYTSVALFELAGILLQTGRTEDAVARYRDLSERFPDTPSSRKALLVLAAYERARFRYGLAARHLEQALPDPEAKRQLRELSPMLEPPLPEEASDLVDGALRDLAPDPESPAVMTLVEVGPAAGARLWGAAERAADREYHLAVVEVLKRWPAEAARGWLARMMTVDDDVVAETILDTLLELRTSPDQIRMMLELHPYATPAADRAYEARFGGAGEVPGLTTLMSSADHRDRIEAARRLTTLDDPAAVPALRQLSVDDSPQVRRAAAAALSLRSEPAAREVIAALLDDVSPLVRLEAFTALARGGLDAPVRDKALADPDARVRLEVARILLGRDSPGDTERVISLLGDSDGGVSSGVEAMLKSSEAESLGPALSEALRAAERPGLAMRIVRVMTLHAGRTFGYDPSGGAEERTRMALEFLKWWTTGREGR